MNKANQLLKFGDKRNGRFPLIGAFSGAVSTFVFTVIHDIFISDIWSMFVIMLVAGALCGACVSWSYGLLVDVSSPRSWLWYNLVYVALFILLGLISVLMFEPVTSMAALIAANGPPDDLIGQALPLTAVFTVMMAVLISWGYGRRWTQFGAVLLTCVVLVLLLGLNVSVIGLVEIPHGSLYLVLEMFGLIIVLNLVYLVVFIILDALQRSLVSKSRARAASSKDASKANLR